MRNWSQRALCFCASAAILGGTVRVQANDGPAPTPVGGILETIGAWDSRQPGWHPALRVGATFAFATSQGVIGVDDGNTLTFGLQLRGSASYLTGQHEWRSTLTLEEALSRTPRVEGVQKPTDILELDTIYLYHFPSREWLGLYARTHFTTSVLPGFDRNDKAQTYEIERLDGTVDTVVSTSLRLTDAFQPLTLSEGVGLEVRSKNRDAFRFELLLGMGARQVFAADQLAIIDIDRETNTRTVKELESFLQGGPELLMTAEGGFEDGAITYRLSVGGLVPAWRSETNATGTAWELTNLLASAHVSFNVLSWLSIDYTFRTLRNPALVDVFQISNSLLFSVNLTLPDPNAERAAASAAEPPPSDP